jgi:hypothetical protein
MGKVILDAPDLRPALQAAYDKGVAQMRARALFELQSWSLHPFKYDIALGLWPWVSRRKITKYLASVEAAIEEKSPL